MQVETYLKKRIAIAHFLPNYEGPCKREHGHTLLVEVWMKGPVDRYTGMLMDFAEVKAIIRRYDHHNLNAMMFELPTMENFAALLLSKIPWAYKVRVWESEDAYAEVRALGREDAYAQVSY